MERPETKSDTNAYSRRSFLKIVGSDGGREAGR
jgi:hypothetical protein